MCVDAVSTYDSGNIKMMFTVIKINLRLIVLIIKTYIIK